MLATGTFDPMQVVEDEMRERYRALREASASEEEFDRALGPLSYKPALTAAYNALQHTNARIKHIILLGDGDAEDSYSAHVTQIQDAAECAVVWARAAWAASPCLTSSPRARSTEW
jgi:hypothetical protein